MNTRIMGHIVWIMATGFMSALVGWNVYDILTAGEDVRKIAVDVGSTVFLFFLLLDTLIGKHVSNDEQSAE